jgi:hypothetical protein
MCVGLLVYDLVFVGIRIEMYGVAGEMCVTGTGRPAKAESTGHFFFCCCVDCSAPGCWMSRRLHHLNAHTIFK